VDRRQILKAGSVSVAATASAHLAIFKPREARAQGIPFSVLSPDEVATVEALADALVPGAREAGVSHYIDHELASPSPRLLLRFAQLPGPMAPYYHGAIAAFTTSVAAGESGRFAALAPEARHGIIEALRTGSLKPWSAGAVTPAMFYGMMRNDGIDVVYGSLDGFKALDIPYMPHIEPKTTW
jgi:hypothetical protein